MPDSLKQSRDRTRNSSDPRTQKTRAAIIAAAHKVLAQEHSTIRISQIAAAASIRRATFYTHFADLEELLIATLEDSFSEITEQFITAATELRNQSDQSQPESSEMLKAALQEETQAKLVAVISGERELLKTMLAAPAAQHLYAELNNVLEAQLTRALDYQQSQTPHATRAVTAKYMAAGTTALFTAWADGRLEATEEELAKHLVSMYPAWLRRIAD